MDDSKELLTVAKLENLNTAMNFIDDELKRAGCLDSVRARIAIAVEEIFVNIANYAYANESGSVLIRISTADEIVIEFEDSGEPFNPLCRQNPDIKANLEEREIGGLGIFIVKNIMDAVEYRYENNKNILKIRKSN